MFVQIEKHPSINAVLVKARRGLVMRSCDECFQKQGIHHVGGGWLVGIGKGMGKHMEQKSWQNRLIPLMIIQDKGNAKWQC